MKKRNLFLSLMALLFSLSPVRGQENLVVNVWDGVPADGKPQARLHVFLPEKGAKPARSVLILPGGGYVHLALGHEGTDWAGFFCPLFKRSSSTFPARSLSTSSPPTVMGNVSCIIVITFRRLPNTKIHPTRSKPLQWPVRWPEEFSSNRICLNCYSSLIKF